MPTRAQERVLLQWVDLTRELYNAGLQERRDAWQKQHVHVSLIDQQQQLPAIRDLRDDLAEVPILVLRGALHHLDRAFKAFFRRCKREETPGFPRFRGRERWRSISVMSFKDIGRTPFVAGGTRIKIPLLGKIKFRRHRPLEGVPKAMHIKHHADGRWYITFACDDIQEKPLPKTGCEIGIDLGITNFAVTNDGEFFDNPRPLTTARLALERAHRRVSRSVLKSKRRQKVRRLFARHHDRVKNIRREHHIVIAKTLVAKYDTIFVEDLDLNRTKKGLARGMLAKHVQDAGWGSFLLWLRLKAESAGREVVGVDPRGTSQTCSRCGVEVKKALSERIHRCKDCGLVVDRDVNAARNIIGAGRALRRAALLVEGQRRPEKVKSSRVSVLGDN